MPHPVDVAFFLAAILRIRTKIQQILVTHYMEILMQVQELLFGSLFGYAVPSLVTLHIFLVLSFILRMIWVRRPTSVAIAWILRHPAKMQVIVGTTNSQRLAEMSKACEVKLTREEWYEIYRSAGNILP